MLIRPRPDFGFPENETSAVSSSGTSLTMTLRRSNGYDCSGLQRQMDPGRVTFDPADRKYANPCLNGKNVLNKGLFCKRHMQNSSAAGMEVDAVVSARQQPAQKPNFPPLKPHKILDGQIQSRNIPVPQRRITPLKKYWLKICTAIYGEMKINVCMEYEKRTVKLKTLSDTPDISNLQKCADFLHAFMLGFDFNDAVALLRVEELYVESFEIKDVKALRGEHLSRAVGRLSGKEGRTRVAIENATKTRIVIADTKVHVLGSFASIKIARDSLCSLILGSPAAKVYSKLRAVTARCAERF
ncbi:UNVERIFIED_CONTAM: RNA-binding protein PNO1 [Sesamum indicum]